MCAMGYEDQRIAVHFLAKRNIRNIRNIIEVRALRARCGSGVDAHR